MRRRLARRTAGSAGRSGGSPAGSKNLPRPRGTVAKRTYGLRRDRARRPPLVERVGRVLLVVGAVGLPHERAAVPFVEAPCAGVLLEDPEVEAVGPPLLREREERAADAVALRGRVDVEVLELVGGEGGEGDHAAVLLCDPRLVAADHHRAEATPDVLLGVRDGCVRHRRAGGEEDIGDVRGVLRSGPPDGEAHRRSVARRRPSATRMAPVTASIARRTAGRRSTRPARATAAAYALSQRSVIAQKSTPSASRPANDDANCGSRL